MSDWIEHTGLECPVEPPNTIVEYRLDGEPETYVEPAKYVAWGETGDGFGRVTHYRVLGVPQGEKPTNPKDAVGVRKAPLSTVPMGVVAEIGVAMLEGAAKYGRHNYRGVGVRASVYFDATMRHLIDWWEGQDVDPDSGMSHITKALASLAVLRDAQIQGKCEDDRPPRSAEFYPRLNALAGAVLDRHADKAPKHWTQAEAEASLSHARIVTSERNT